MKKIVLKIIPLFLILFFAGCYTQLKMVDHSSEGFHSDYQNYSREEEQESYYEEDSLNYDESQIINNYYYLNSPYCDPFWYDPFWDPFPHWGIYAGFFYGWDPFWYPYYDWRWRYWYPYVTIYPGYYGYYYWDPYFYWPPGVYYGKKYAKRPFNRRSLIPPRRIVRGKSGEGNVSNAAGDNRRMIRSGSRVVKDERKAVKPGRRVVRPDKAKRVLRTHKNSRYRPRIYRNKNKSSDSKGKSVKSGKRKSGGKSGYRPAYRPSSRSGSTSRSYTPRRSSTRSSSGSSGSRSGSSSGSSSRSAKRR